MCHGPMRLAVWESTEDVAIFLYRSMREILQKMHKNISGGPGVSELPPELTGYSTPALRALSAKEPRHLWQLRDRRAFQFNNFPVFNDGFRFDSRRLHQ